MSAQYLDAAMKGKINDFYMKLTIRSCLPARPSSIKFQENYTLFAFSYPYPECSFKYRALKREDLDCERVNVACEPDLRTWPMNLYFRSEFLIQLPTGQHYSENRISEIARAYLFFGTFGSG